MRSAHLSLKRAGEKMRNGRGLIGELAGRHALRRGGAARPVAGPGRDGTRSSSAWQGIEGGRLMCGPYDDLIYFQIF
jgi:hypothetical protein